MRTGQGTKNHSIRTLLADLACPTLLVVGANDRIVDPTESQTAAAGLPHVRTIVLEKCGHAPQIEKANYINRLITKFFA